MKLPKAVERALELGWSIMPLNLEKKPYLKWTWMQTQRPTRKQVEAWQEKYNPPAWGIITGALSGVFIVDFDDYGEDAADLAAKLPQLVDKKNVRTGSGGSHIYFKHPGFHVRTLNSKTSKKSFAAAGYKGLDIRGDGGYAVFYGRNESGAYKWLRPVDPSLTVDILPDDLRNAAALWPPDDKPASAPAKPPAAATTKPAGRKKPLEQWALDEALSRQAEGRNAAGFWLSMQLRDAGWSRGDAERFILDNYQPAVKQTNAKGQREPYTAEEARASVEAAFSRPAREKLITKAEQAAADRAEFTQRAEEARRRNAQPDAIERMAAATAGAWEAAAAHTAATTEPLRKIADVPPTPPPQTEQEPQGSGGDDDNGTWAPGTRQTGAYRCKLDDIGNAERFTMQHRGNVRYCATMGKWFVWDQKRMQLDDTEQVYYLGAKTARGLWDEIKYARDESDRDRRIQHAKKSGGNERINAMVTIARRLPGVPVRSKEIDAHPWLVNVGNGTIDLRKAGTGKELREHRRGDFITKIIPTHYVPGAKCPAWLDFLNLIMGGNQALIRYLQICIGYCLSGDISERTLFVPWGNGANGKSTFLIAIHELFNDYAMKTPSSTLVSRKENSIPNDIARLQGARLVYASETKDGGKLSEDTVKELTGGEVLTARFMRGEFFEFLPNFKLWLATNHRPRIDGTDKGIWDRIKLIPFLIRIPEVLAERERAQGLPPGSLYVSRESVLESFRREREGILAWAVEGARLYVEAGRIPEPAEVSTATNAYREDMDTLAHFLEEYTEHTASADHTVRSSVLYECFKEWATENGEYVVSQKVFSNRILERGFIRKRTPAGQVFLNLKLRKIPDTLKCRDMYSDEPKNDISPPRSPHEPVMSKMGTQSSITLHPDEEGVEI